MAGINWGDFSQPLTIQRSSRASTMTSSGPNYASGVAGFAERMLPAILGTAGAVGGSLIAPGIGTAAGGAGGSVLGQKLEDLLTGQHTSGGGYLADAALGTLGGVGKGLSAAKGATSALRAGEGLGAAGNALRFGTRGAAAVANEGSSGVLGDAVLASNANAGNTVGQTLAKGASTMGKQAMLSPVGSLSKGTAANALRDVNDLRSIGYSSIAKAADHAPAITGENGALTVARNQLLKSPDAQLINTSDLPQAIKQIIGNNVSIEPTKATKLESKLLGTQTDTATSKLRNASQSSSNIFDKHGLYGGEAGIGLVQPENLSNALKDIGKLKADPGTPERKALDQIYGMVKDRLNNGLADVSVDRGMKDQILNQLQQAGINGTRLKTAILGANSWGDLAQIESKFVTAAKANSEGAANALRGGVPGLMQSSKPTLTGMINQAGGRAAERGISAGTNLFERFAGKAPQEIAGPGQLASQAAKKVGATQAVVRGPGALAGMAEQNAQQNQQSVTPTPQLDNSVESLPGFQGGSQQTDQSQTPFNSEAIQHAALVDIATTGGKNLQKLDALYNTFGSPKAQQTLTADQQKRVDNMNQAAATLQEYYNQLQQAGGGKGLAIGPAESLLGKIGLGGQPAAQARALNATRVDIATSLAQAMTGNSRPAQQQINFWLDSIPQLNDPQPVAQQKLKNILGIIQARSGAIGGQ